MSLATLYGLTPEEARFLAEERDHLESLQLERLAAPPPQPHIRLGDVHFKALPYARTLELGET